MGNLGDSKNPEVVDPEIVDPEVVDLEVVDAEVVDPEVVDPALDPEVVDPEVVESEVVDPVLDPEVVDPEVVEKDIQEERDSNDDQKSITNIFQTVWKIGPSDANKYYSQGCRSLDDLRNNPYLNENQKIGLKYYEELKRKIPRDAITEYLKLLKEIFPEYTIEAVGSYRRENFLCGDIDLLVYNDNDNVDLAMAKERMLASDLLIEVMCVGVKKMMGLAKILYGSKDTIICHVDINVTLKVDLPFALLTHTGNMVFNIQMRQLSQERGMKLSQYGFSPLGNVTVKDKQGAKVVDTAKVVDVAKVVDADKVDEINKTIKTEEDVFSVLRVPYIAPNQRNYKTYPSLTIISEPTLYHRPNYSHIERIPDLNKPFYRLVSY